SDYLIIDGTINTLNGIVDLQGGTVEWRGPLTVGVGGVISGRGSINTNSANPAAAAGLSNNGTLQLSAGFTDIFGPVASTSGSRIIVTGGGTTTFYRNVSLAAGSNFQVSANSSAVFFGNVSGTGNFTGSGTKYFEAGSSVLGSVEDAGSTVVQAPASVTASFFRENSLTVTGHTTLTTSGGASHLNQLNIDPNGVLDLKNNSLVLEAADLAVVTDQIRNGLVHGTGMVSSSPGASYRLGAISNSNGAGGPIYSSFQGISGLNGDEVLVRYTVIGDLNLDGTVSISDFIDLAAHFNVSSGATWQIGDVNYDGAVTIADFIDLASNFNQSIAGDASPIGAAVPEPSLAALAIVGMSLAIGRRRRHLLAS
ncbi:MAG TPA: dockerin type I repeat-containing protein, partial [Pirellulaceae bacterium]|nr:dockerin type I repeat-containing protein [Pirellulaceae bacterium]